MLKRLSFNHVRQSLPCITRLALSEQMMYGYEAFAAIEL